MSELSRDTGRIRVEFDSTLDEVVDANIRLVRHTTSFRRQRLWSQLFAGGCLTVVLVALTLLRDQPPPGTVAVVVGIGLVAGLVVGYRYGSFHDWYVRQCY